MEKEYGGFLPLELARGKEYYREDNCRSILRLNCGRSAFYCALINSGAKKIYMPHLNAQNSIDPIIQAGVDFEYYHLDSDLTPKGIKPAENEMVMWINYYGNATDRQKVKVQSSYSNLIIDNCHAFFSEPLTAAYNCYSTRKFFGVCDGAYLIADRLKTFNLREDFSYKRAEFLLKTIELGTNPVYRDNLINEQTLASCVCKMSKLTQRILQSIDYEQLKLLRHTNMLRLHQRIKDINEFEVNIASQTHMYYPLLLTRDGLRSRLLGRRLYTPTWWRHVPESCGFADIETSLSNYMLMIPIDQRYTIEDMESIADIIYEEYRR